MALSTDVQAPELSLLSVPLRRNVREKKRQATQADTFDISNSLQSTRLMKLRTFIEETLTEIASGIANANERLQTTGAVANPSNIYVQCDKDSKIFAVWDQNALEMHPTVELIEFDVAIISDQSAETGANVGVSISIAKFGAGGKSMDRASETSRVKFRVPFVYPRPSSARKRLRC